MAKMICTYDGFILGVGENESKSADVSEAEYQRISDLIQNRPDAPDGYQYRLRADNLEWELVKLPPVEPEPSEDVDDSEALNIILGGGKE